MPATEGGQLDERQRSIMVEYQIEVLLETIAERSFGEEIQVFWNAETDIEVCVPSLRYALREAFECGRSVK
ncbi:hypothetical protein DF042_27270 [Burkholderia cenocepacia]|nr:hypothetical protein DF042_27270 [Burkholderia cenocepacia]